MSISIMDIKPGQKLTEEELAIVDSSERVLAAQKAFLAFEKIQGHICPSSVALECLEGLASTVNNIVNRVIKTVNERPGGQVTKEFVVDLLTKETQVLGKEYRAYVNELKASAERVIASEELKKENVAI